MAIKQNSLQSITTKGSIPSVVYAAVNPNRIVNPSWSFTRTVVVTFKESGSWTCPTGVTEVEYLVVAGGGGGAGGYGSGGGGAGGFRTGAGYAVTAGQSYTITVGAGGGAGPAVPGTPNFGSNGSSSVFDTITSAGGGGGGSGDSGDPSTDVVGRNGGSGGGGGYYSTNLTGAWHSGASPAPWPPAG